MPFVFYCRVLLPRHPQLEGGVVVSFMLIFLGMALIGVSAYVSIKCHPDKDRLALDLWGCGALLVLLGSALYIWNY